MILCPYSFSPYICQAISLNIKEEHRQLLMYFFLSCQPADEYRFCCCFIFFVPQNFPLNLGVNFKFFSGLWRFFHSHSNVQKNMQMLTQLIYKCFRWYHKCPFEVNLMIIPNYGTLVHIMKFLRDKLESFQTAVNQNEGNTVTCKTSHPQHHLFSFRYPFPVACTARCHHILYGCMCIFECQINLMKGPRTTSTSYKNALHQETKFQVDFIVCLYNVVTSYLFRFLQSLVLYNGRNTIIILNYVQMC